MNLKRITSLAVTAAIPLLFSLTACKDAGRSPDTTGMGTNTAATAEADNTRKNERDKDNTTLTPEDQGTTEADRQISQRVRKEIVSSDKNFTTVAKNVKIITANGKVTLRGPVSTEAEKAGIDMIAKKVAGDGNVDNQLEVKANP
jgi:hyperosmotically inducible protein